MFPPRRSKNGNKFVYVDEAGNVVPGPSRPGVRKFSDSGIEYRYFLYLVQLSRLGVISGLQYHKVKFKLHAVTPDGERVELTSYTPDFTYIQGGRRHVVDVKGRTDKADKVYELKKEWMRVEHGIEIEEVRKVP